MEHQENKGRKVARPDEGDSLEVIADKFQKLLDAPKELKRPPGTITCSEYADRTKAKRGTVAEWFRRLHAEGKVERFKIGSVYFYRIPGEDGKEE